MAYSDFTLPELKKRFLLKVDEHGRTKTAPFELRPEDDEL